MRNFKLEAIAVLKEYYKGAAKAKVSLVQASPVAEDMPEQGMSGAYKGNQAFFVPAVAFPFGYGGNCTSYHRVENRKTKKQLDSSEKPPSLALLFGVPLGVLGRSEVMNSAPEGCKADL